jgi:hypothetical protein
MFKEKYQVKIQKQLISSKIRLPSEHLLPKNNNKHTKNLSLYQKHFIYKENTN